MYSLVAGSQSDEKRRKIEEERKPLERVKEQWNHRGWVKGTYGSDAVHFKSVTEDEAGFRIVHPAANGRPGAGPQRESGGDRRGGLVEGRVGADRHRGKRRWG